MSYSVFNIYNKNNFDASERQRVSQITSLGDYKQINDNLPLFFTEGGTGTSTYDITLGATNMSVASGEYLVRESIMFHNYSAGKSQLIEMTFSDFQNETGVVKRAGYYSSSTVAPYDQDLDGFFLESSGGDYFIKIYRAGTLIANISRSNWNDPLDGTGPSGINYDFSKFTVLGFDFLYLGGTTLRCFIVQETEFKGPKFIEFFSFRNSGLNSDIIIQSPNQKVRYEIIGISGAGSMKAICSTVGSEGALDSVGITRTVNTETNEVDATTAATKYVVKAIRLKTGYKDISVIPTSLSLLATNNDDFKWELIINPSIQVGSISYSSLPNSAVESGTPASGTTATVTNNSIVLYSGYVTGNSHDIFEIKNRRNIGVSVDGVFDELVVCVTPLTNGLDIHAALNFVELL